MLVSTDELLVEMQCVVEGDNWYKAEFLKRPGCTSVGVGQLPGSVWDVSEPANPRRLNVCIVEFYDGGDTLPPPNFKWDPDNSAQGKYEYLFIMGSDYDSTGMTYADSNVLLDDMDNLYAWWPRLADGHTFFEPDTVNSAINTYIALLSMPFQVSVHLHSV